MSRAYKIANGVHEKARKLGVEMGSAELSHMAYMSAPFSKVQGFNRRYEDFVLLVANNTIEDIGLLGNESKRGPREIVCPTCKADGDFCMECLSTGKITIS